MGGWQGKTRRQVWLGAVGAGIGAVLGLLIPILLLYQPIAELLHRDGLGYFASCSSAMPLWLFSVRCGLPLLVPGIFLVLLGTALGHHLGQE